MNHVTLNVKSQANSSYLPIRWCFSDKLLNEINKRPECLDNAYIIFTISKKIGKKYIETDRIASKAKNLLEYITFQSSGNFIVSSLLLFKDYKKNELLMTKTVPIDRKYHLRHIHEDGSINKELTGTITDYIESCVIQGDTIRLEIDESLFAKKPHKLLWKWVNLLHHTPPRDQCAFRKRFLTAFTIQPILVALYMTFFTLYNYIILFYQSLFMKRNINWKLLKPSISNHHEDRGICPNFINTDKNNNKRPFIDSLLIAFLSPFIPLTMAIIYTTFKIINVDNAGFYTFGTYKIILLFTLCISLIIALHKIIKISLNKLLSKSIRLNMLKSIVKKSLDPIYKNINEKFKNIEDARIDKENKTRELKINKINEVLSCNNNDIDDLPYKKFSLRLKELKSKLCKPFQQ